MDNKELRLGDTVIPLESEEELSNDYPVYWDYYYLADNKIILSDIQGTVRDLKHDLKAKVIRNFDISARIPK